MSQINGYIYIDTSTTPPKGVSIDDVRTALNDSHRDIGNLCVSTKINPWSLNKPVRLGTPYQSAGWQASSAGNYGIVPYRIGTGAQALSTLYNFAFDGAMNGWTYEKPRGLATYSEWYRLMDFNGYDHHSPNPWSGWTGVSSVVRGSSAWFGLDNVVAGWDESSFQPVTPSSIYYGDILLQMGLSTTAYLSASYFGVAIFNSSGACVSVATCQNQMGASPSSTFLDANWSCGFDDISWSAGNYRAIPFFWITDTNQPMPSGWTSIQYGEIYTIPYTQPKTVSVVASDDPSVATIYLTGSCGVDDETSSSLIIGLSPIIGMNGPNTYTLQRVWIRLYPESGSGDLYLYDTSTDSDYTPATLSGDGNSWYLVDQPSGDTGLTNCPSQITARKILGGSYTVNVLATVVSNGGAIITVSKNYPIS